MPFADYAREVISLARAAVDFAGRSEKQFEDVFDRWEWLGWQNELRETLDTISTLVD